MSEKKSNKTGFLFAIIKIALKSTKFLKVGLAGASFAAYSYMFNWQFAAMLLIMIFVHEFGHVVAMKQCGMKVKGIYLIPFFGGAAVSEGDFKSRRDESYIALMGPWYGLLVSIMLYVTYVVTNNPIFAAGATWCSLINLFNLLPINPMDGGRILKSLAFSINNKIGLIFLVLSLILMIYITIHFKIWLFLLLLFFAVLELGFELYIENKKRQRNESKKKLKKDIDSINFDLLDEIDKEKINDSINFVNSLEELSTEKPKMSLKQILIYSGLYLLTCFVFLVLMSFTSNLPGCAEALEFLK